MWFCEDLVGDTEPKGTTIILDGSILDGSIQKTVSRDTHNTFRVLIILCKERRVEVKACKKQKNQEEAGEE